MQDFNCNGLAGLCNLAEMFEGTASCCSVKSRATDALVVVSKDGMVLSCMMCSTPTNFIAGALTARLGPQLGHYSGLCIPAPRGRHTFDE